MRKCNIPKFLLALFCLTGACGLYGNPVSAASSQGPRLYLEQDAFDFKGVKEGEVLEHTFRVSNRGEVPLEIKKVVPG